MKGRAAASARVRTSESSWGTWVELCAPQVRNALDPGAVEALLEVFTASGSGAVLLSGRGPVFCAGGDLAVLADAAATGDLAGLLTTRAAAFADLVEAMLACPRPVVAAVDGPAVGGGVSLALACDVRIVSTRARLVLGWARWGLPPDGGAAALLTSAVGAAAAASMLATAADIGTGSPYADRLFSRVVEPAQLEAEAVAAVASLLVPGDRATKLAAVRAAREAELAALAAAASDPTVVARLANVYKMEK